MVRLLVHNMALAKLKNVKQKTLVKSFSHDQLLKYKWYNLVRRAKKKNLECSISMETAFSLFVSACIYCGGNNTDNVIGIDRIENNLGYTTENSVSCCSVCNRLKSNYTVFEFLIACKNICHPDSAVYHLFNSNYDYKGSPYNVYKNIARRKRKSFRLTIEDFENLQDSNCFYCSRVPTSNFSMGVDRIDNEKGYLKNNVVPCCSRCNRMKSNFTESAFKLACIKVNEKWENFLLQFLQVNAKHNFIEQSIMQKLQEHGASVL